MESDIHDNCSGNRWSSCENFNAPSMDFQGYMSISREQHLAPRVVNKDSAPAYNPFVALNYPQDVACLSPHLYQQHSVSGRELWQYQGQQYVKRKSSVTYSLSHPLSRKFFNSKHLYPSSVNVSSTAGNLPLQPIDASFPPIEMPSQQTPAFFSPVEEPLVSCNKTALNGHPSSNLCNSKYRTTICRSNSSIVASTRKRRKNPLPKKRVKCHKMDFQVKNKRSRNEDSWLRNRRKKARAKGESYVSVVGKTVPARSVKLVDCSKCKFSCQSRVSEEDRQKLFDLYWGLETFKEKVDFICNSVQEFVPLRPKSGKRAFSRRYKLLLDGKEERVCKEFFTSTFDVHESTIGTYLNKKRQDSDAIQDLRGKQAPSNKTPDNVLRKIREHILSQIGLQSSFDIASSEETKSVKQLYGLYKVECNEENVKPAGISVYRKVFSDLHKGKNARPITLPPVKDFNRCVKTSKNRSGATSKDTGNKETSIPLSSVPSSHVGQSLSAYSESHQDSMKVPTSNCNDISSQHTELSSVTVPSFNFINDNVISPSVKTRLSSYNSNLSVFPIPHNCCVQSQDIMEHGSLGLPVFQHQHIQSHRSMQLSGTCSHKDGKDCSHNEKDQSRAETASCSSKTLIRNNLADCSQSSCENNSSSTLSNYKPSLSSCSEDDPQFMLPQHIISSLQDEEDNIVLESSKTAICKSTDGGKTNNSKANERGSRHNVMEDVNLQKSKTGSEVKKRQRNEELWARNVRKRLRFKGEEYTSVTGKKVQARKVQVVDCSKCKFKCPTKVCEKQREQINSFYWNLDSYESKVAFIAKHVQTYQPKRKMTGRRAFSRNYTFEVDGEEVRVCKDFFQATLDIGQSTVATSLEKTRKGPEAVKELRGKRSPVNKTPDTIIQDICELIVFVTGLRPHRNHEKNCFGHNVKSLYQAYVYDAEVKGKKVASVGVFRSVLQKEFGLSGISNLTKIKKLKESSNLYQAF